MLPGSGGGALCFHLWSCLHGSIPGSGGGVLQGSGRDLLPGAPSAYMQPSAMRGRIEGVQRGGQSRVKIEGVGIVFKMRLL